MNFSLIDTRSIIVFFLLFVRIAAMLAIAPIFSIRSIPPQLKIALALFLAYIVSQVLAGTLPAWDSKDISIINIGLMVLSEAILGLLIGYTSQMIFIAIQFGGRILDIAMGMHLASVVNPMTQEQQSLIGQLQYITAILLFVLLNGHHYLILGVIKSFSYIPSGFLVFKEHFGESFLGLFGNAFIIGVNLALPIAAILFLIDLSLGIIAKGVPQMNVFITGMPIKQMTGFLLLFFVYSFYGEFFVKMPELCYKYMITILKALSYG